jgi:two-component system, cell cycle sensor histidine kinase and response regulator CckA
MSTHPPFSEAGLKARIADLTRRLAEAEAALEAATEAGQVDAAEQDSQSELLFEAQQTLAMEHNLLRTVIDIIPDHVFVRDRSARHLINNRAQLEVLRAKTLEETIGKTDYDFYPKKLARQFSEDNERVMALGQTLANIEEMIPGPTGEEAWWSTTKVPLRDRDGNVIGLVGIGRNITERRQAVQKITEQAAMLDQANEAILLLSLDNRITYMNAAAESLLGWKASEALGKVGHELYPEEDRQTLIDATTETLAKGSWHGELRLHNRKGDELFVEIRRTLIRDENGAPKAQLSISADITEKRKRDALALRNQRLESIGTLAGGIAHDLNNVLAPILMSIALLKLKVSDDSGRKLLATLELNAERGAQLVRQVLAFGRGAEGDQMLVQPMHIAREIQQIVRDTFPKTLKFELKAERSPWTLTGDPTQLHQVLLNLCVNARDAMPNGGTITMRIENTVLDETYSSMNPEAKPGPYVAISVADTGTGIPAAIRDRIFEPFFTTKDIGKGTGLGLSTSLGIVQGHGGFITVASDVGKGSTFKIYIPANVIFAAAETASTKPAEPQRGHGELILVVDDEEPILEVAKSTLERFGYRVETALNGATAVSVYVRHMASVAVVITDMAMPIMDGSALVAALRAINPGVRIIGSSGFEEGGISAAAKAGIREFIPKPYSAETMLRTIARALQRDPDRDPAQNPDEPAAHPGPEHAARSPKRSGGGPQGRKAH